MSRLIDELLKLSRVTRLEMHTEDVNLSEITGRIVRELAETQPQRQVEFVIAPGITARGDSQLLQILLRNLLENAWKFTSKNPLTRIEFGLKVYNEEKVYYIKDNGVGFDMKYASRLFQPFQRLHRESDFSGTGIGLATAQRIVHRHGGRIWAEAEIGKGATFYFTIGNW
jgi:light-regulated signal transduction histidine kinase (bacteriophytochrome)